MRNILIITNPKSGTKKGKAILSMTEDLFTQNGINYVVSISKYHHHPYKIALESKLEIFDSIAVIGGDGTMHEVINGMLSRPDHITLPIGLIPAGTGNSLMHDLNCLDPQKAITNIINGNLRKIDIIEIQSSDTHYYAFNIVGWGVPVDINRIAEKLRWAGGQRYNIGSIIEIIRNRSRQVRLTLDKEIIDDTISFFMACNTVYTGNGMKMSPESDFGDGLLDVFYVTRSSRLKLLSLFIKVFSGTHIGDPILKSTKVKSFSIETRDSQELNIDGQCGYFTPIHCNVTDLQLDIFS